MTDAETDRLLPDLASDLPPDLPASSYDILRRSSERHPAVIALTFFLDVAAHRRPRQWSYARLFEEVTRTANLFHALGVGSGEVVAIMLPNLPETHFALWGGEAAGIVMPVNPLLEPSAIATLLSAAGARVLVTLAPFPGTDLHDKAAIVASLVPTLRDIVLVDMTCHVARPKRIVAAILAWRARRRAARLPGTVGVHRFGPSIGRQPADRLLSRRRISADDTASYLCTGGTTGLPKIAVRTHGQEVANAWMLGARLNEMFDSDAALFCGLPLFHVNAIIATGLAPFLIGARVVLGTPQGFRAPGLVERFWEIVAHHRISAFSAVPTLLAMLLEQPVEGHDLSSLRVAFSGAAPLSAELLRRFEARCGVVVVEGYGLTETACAASLNPIKGDRRAGSVGLSLPLQSIHIVIFDESGAFDRDAAVDEVGRVAIAGPNVFSGYLTAEHNARLWIERGDGRRWLDTGDLGRIDGDGYLWLTGRTKDLIIRGGHNIDPSVIEDALGSHPDVALVAAIGRPDRHAGEVPVAYVQLAPSATADVAALAAHVAARIGERAAIPRAIVIVDRMPVTPIGKIHKPSLRLRETVSVAGQALAERGIVTATVQPVTDGRSAGQVRIHAPAVAGDDVRAALQGYGFAYDLVSDADAP